MVVHMESQPTSYLYTSILPTFRHHGPHGGPVYCRSLALLETETMGGAENVPQTDVGKWRRETWLCLAVAVGISCPDFDVLFSPDTTTTPFSPARDEIDLGAQWMRVNDSRL